MKPINDSNTVSRKESYEKGGRLAFVLDRLFSSLNSEKDVFLKRNAETWLIKEHDTKKLPNGMSVSSFSGRSKP